MTEAEALTLQMLKQIDQKLESLIGKLSDPSGQKPSDLERSRSPFTSAKQIAAMTPRSVRQTDAVELLHEDRSR
jgi:hypothetical protein